MTVIIIIIFIIIIIIITIIIIGMSPGQTPTFNHCTCPNPFNSWEERVDTKNGVPMLAVERGPSRLRSDALPFEPLSPKDRLLKPKFALSYYMEYPCMEYTWYGTYIVIYIEWNIH